MQLPGSISRHLLRRLVCCDREFARALILPWLVVRLCPAVQIAMGGMTNRWVVEAVKAQDWFQPRARQVCFCSC